jgi:spore coat polysaccharide biosynthesis protein SpsF (cytidylyltransferase family)
MTTAVIVQARYSSTRLPGKVLYELCGKTVLAHVLERCQAITNSDMVVCAVAEGDVHDIVAEEALRTGSVVIRGNVDDVLDRYLQAARAVNADVVMRVTSDCPLIDPEICVSVLQPVLANKADFATNNMPATWPHGLDCEAFTRALLERTAHEARSCFEREHVTPYMRTAANIRRVNISCSQDVVADPSQRWTLDTPQDFEFMQAVFAALPAGQAGWTHAATKSVLDAHREMLTLNSNQDNIIDTRMQAKHDCKDVSHLGKT